MSHKRTPLQLLAVWALCGLAFGTLAVGCGGSQPSTTPTPDNANPPPPPPPPPIVISSNEPTAADVAAARPKDISDPFTKPANKGAAMNIGPAATPAPASTTAAVGKNKNNKNKNVAVVPTPEAPKTPPTPPTVIAVGIFASKHGPEAILADKANANGGTMIVTTGYRLSDGGYVKSIDPVSRKVVIDKENTDFVLPLEAAPSGSPSPSTPGK